MRSRLDGRSGRSAFSLAFLCQLSCSALAFSPQFSLAPRKLHKTYLPAARSTLKDSGDSRPTADKPPSGLNGVDTKEVEVDKISALVDAATDASSADITLEDKKRENDAPVLAVERSEKEVKEAKRDAKMMHIAMQQAQSRGGERGARSPFPKPIVGAIIVTKDGQIMGKGRASYKKDAVRAAIADAGIVATPLREWCVTWPNDQRMRKDISEATLYVTLEPSTERQGTSVPSITELILESGISRVVIGCPDPIPEYANKGASHLHASGLSVTMGVEEEECENLISEYASLAMTQLHRMARAHFNGTGRVSEYVVNFVRKRNKCCTPANKSLLSLPILPTPPFTASWFSTLQRH